MPNPSRRASCLLLAAALALASPARAEERSTPHDDAAALADTTRGLMTVLAGWSLGSISAGAVMATSDDRAVRFAGVQNLAWGAIDGAIAGYALATLKREDDPSGARRKLARLFLVNAALDVAYVTVGALLATQDDARLGGSGAAVVTQGAFLLGFDLAGALLVGR